MITKRLVFLLVSLVAVVAVACGKTADDERVQDRATAEAEAQARAVGTTTITSAEMESAPAGVDSGARAFLAEQDDYRVRLRDALDVLDQSARADRRPDHVRQRARRRDLLKHDLELLERSTEATWATARAKIERDLRSTSAPQSPSR